MLYPKNWCIFLVKHMHLSLLPINLQTLYMCNFHLSWSFIWFFLKNFLVMLKARIEIGLPCQEQFQKACNIIFWEVIFKILIMYLLSLFKILVNHWPKSRKWGKPTFLILISSATWKKCVKGLSCSYFSVKALQQNVFLYAKWFHYILSEFTSLSKWGLVENSEFTSLMNED